MRHGWRPGKPDGRAVKPARQADVSARLRERVFPIDQDRGRAVEKVRRAWLADAFLTRTSPPKNAEAFLALAVIHGEHTQEHNTLYTKLSHGESGYQATAQLVSRAQAATPKQTLMLALALLVCEWESATSRSTWRNPRERDDRYLSALTAWGYKPSDVEQLLLVPPAGAEASDTEDAATDATATTSSDNGVLTKLQRRRPGAVLAPDLDVDHTCSAVLTTHFSAAVERCRLEPGPERPGCRQDAPVLGSVSCPVHAKPGSPGGCYSSTNRPRRRAAWT